MSVPSTARSYSDSEYSGLDTARSSAWSDSTGISEDTSDWFGDASQISLGTLPKRTNLTLQTFERIGPDPRKKKFPPLKTQGKRLKRPGKFEWESRWDFTPEMTGFAITNLSRALNLAVTKKDYANIPVYMDATTNMWPMSPRQYSKSMKLSLTTCCESNNVQGLRELITAAGHLPRDLSGDMIYFCAANGYPECAEVIWPYTTDPERSRALFRAMEKRHIGIIRFLLQKDTERALLRDVPAASGGAHNLLGTALELGAASGDYELVATCLDHIYDSRTEDKALERKGQNHTVPRHNRVCTCKACKLYNDPRKGHHTCQAERAHHWCWKYILRGRHAAQLNGHVHIAHLLASQCHDSRPSRPSTATLSRDHPARPHMSNVLWNHVTHRQQSKWHARDLPLPDVADAASVDNTVSTLETGSLAAISQSPPRSRRGRVDAITAAESGFFSGTADAASASIEKLLKIEYQQREDATNSGTFPTNETVSLKEEDSSVYRSRFYIYGRHSVDSIMDDKEKDSLVLSSKM